MMIAVLCGRKHWSRFGKRYFEKLLTPKLTFFNLRFTEYYYSRMNVERKMKRYLFWFCSCFLAACLTILRSFFCRNIPLSIIQKAAENTHTHTHTHTNHLIPNHDDDAASCYNRFLILPCDDGRYCWYSIS
jgi:hypothetical protein